MNSLLHSYFAKTEAILLIGGVLGFLVSFSASKIHVCLIGYCADMLIFYFIKHCSEIPSYVFFQLYSKLLGFALHSTKCLNECYWEALSVRHTFLTFPFVTWYTFSAGWPMCNCYVLTPHDECKGMSQSLWVIFSLTELSSSRNPWTFHHIKLVAMESPCPGLPLTSHFGN